MLHALVGGSGGGGGQEKGKRHDSLRLTVHRKPLESNTRASALPLGAHTLLHKLTQATNETVWRQGPGRDYRQQKEPK